MDLSAVADTVIAIVFAGMFILCAFTMLRWVLSDGSDRGGPFGCMGGGHHRGRGAPEDQVVDQLRAERHRLNARIARAERDASGRAG